MKFVTYLTAILVLAVSSNARPLERESVQPRLQIGTTYELMVDVEYCTGGGHPLKSDIIRPKTSLAKPMPVVVFIHGNRGHKDDPMAVAVLAAFARRGYFGVSMDYRRIAEASFPAQLEDAKCAIRFLRARAKEFHIDPGRIAAIGSALGGLIAALLGTTRDVKELLAGPSDIQREFEEARQRGYHRRGFGSLASAGRASYRGATRREQRKVG